LESIGYTSDPGKRIRRWDPPMDTTQYSTLLEALKDVPDPRKARGQRYTLEVLVTLNRAVS